MQFTTRDTSNRFTTCISNSCQACLSCFETCLKYISRQAYIETGRMKWPHENEKKIQIDLTTSINCSDSWLSIPHGWKNGIHTTIGECTACICHQFHWRFRAILGQSICCCSYSRCWHGNVENQGKCPSHVGAASAGRYFCLFGCPHIHLRI